MTQQSDSVRFSVCCYWLSAFILILGAVVIAILIGSKSLSLSSSLTSFNSAGVIVVRPRSLGTRGPPLVVSYSSHNWSLPIHHLGEVPNTFQSRLTITNMGWDIQLTDTTSDLFRLLSRELEDNLRVIFNSEDLKVKVTEFRSSSSVVVTAVLRWEENREAWTEERIKETLVQTIKESNGRLHHQFMVELDSVEVRRVVKNCRSLGCRRVDCEFSLTDLRFFCLCEAETLNKIDCVRRQVVVRRPGERAGPLRAMIDVEPDSLVPGAVTTELVDTTTEHSQTEEVPAPQTIELDTTFHYHSSTSTTTTTTTSTSPTTTTASTTSTTTSFSTTESG